MWWIIYKQIGNEREIIMVIRKWNDLLVSSRRHRRWAKGAMDSTSVFFNLFYHLLLIMLNSYLIIAEKSSWCWKYSVKIKSRDQGIAGKKYWWNIIHHELKKFNLMCEAKHFYIYLEHENMWSTNWHLKPPTFCAFVHLLQYHALTLTICTDCFANIA